MKISSRVTLEDFIETLLKMLIARMVQNSTTVYKYTNRNAQKYLLTTSDFRKGMQDDINLYITHDRPDNGSFREMLELIEKNIFCRQDPLELVLQDLMGNPIVGSLLKELNLVKKRSSHHFHKESSKHR